MKPFVTRIGVILSLCVCGLAVSQALSWERWVASGQVAGEAVLAQEIRLVTSPIAGSRFARPVPWGWAAPSLAGARDRPDEPWRLRLAQLGLPVAAQGPRMWVGPAGATGLSMGFDDEERAVALPKPRLVKDVLAAMPDKCDDRLFGTWYCGISCLYDDCEADGGIIALKRSIDPDGYERVHQHRYIAEKNFLSEWRVERKWGATVGNLPIEKGKLVAASCNGKTDAGYSTLSVNLKNPNGSDRHLYSYWVDQANRTLWIQSYRVRWEGDKMHKKSYDRRECRRDLKDYRCGASPPGFWLAPCALPLQKNSSHLSARFVAPSSILPH